MLRYASSETLCRNQFLLSYFGQIDSPRCGRCDVCRAERIETDKEEIHMIREKIKTILSKRSTTLENLVEASGYESAKVLKEVEWLVDQGKIDREKDLKLSWKNSQS